MKTETKKEDSKFSDLKCVRFIEDLIQESREGGATAP